MFSSIRVLWYGIGCAGGGILGGYWGQLLQAKNRMYLPVFMASTTFLAIVPFAILLNTSFTNAHTIGAMVLATSAGFTLSLPSVCVRPCLLNVNPPETRSAALTAATLFTNIGKGFGPSCVTLLISLFHVDRHFAMNLTVRNYRFVSTFVAFD